MIAQYSGLRREIYILAFGRLVTGLGSMAWPMMTLILSRKMGVSAGGISWILAAAMILMAPAIFLGGRIADRCNKKMTIICLDLVSVTFFFICAWIPLSWATIIFMFIGSVCQNMENPAYSALTADITVTADRDRAYSLQYLCANLGLVLSPTLAGLLFNNYLWLIFLINGLSILSSAALIYMLVKDITPSVDDGRSAAYQQERAGESLIRVLKDNKVIMLFIVAASGYYAVYNMYVYLMPLDLAEWHGANGPLIYGSITSVNCVVVVLFTPVINKLFGQRPEPDRTLAGTSLLVAGFGLFLMFAGCIPMYYVAMVVLTWGEIFAMTSESAYLSRRVPASHRGRITGVFTVVRTAIGSLFQLLTGVIYEETGSLAAWIAVLAAGAGFTALTLVMRSQDKKAYPNLY